MAPWEYRDFDDHESVHVFRDTAAGLTAVIAIHSTALGPAAGGVRFWHYARGEDAITDALRLSRGMSFKNAMAGLALGGGKAVIVADADRRKTPAMLQSFGNAVESLGGRYVTAADVAMTDADMIAIGGETRHVTGLPPKPGMAGGDPGPATARGVFLGVKAAVARALGKDSVAGVHVAVQGVGSVGGRLARLLAAEGARLTIADVDGARAAQLAAELGAETVSPEAILTLPVDVVSPCALGGVLDDMTIAGLQAPIVAGAANNQLATAADGPGIHARGILWAPDYVINAGGIINVGLQYLGGTIADVEARVARIPDRLIEVWDESTASGEPAAIVAQRIAMRRIGRG